MASATASAAASATLVSTPGRITSIAWCAGATAGTLVFKDGGSSGTVRATVYTPASAAAAGSWTLGGSGLQFTTDIYVAVTNAVGVSIAYETI